MQISSVAITDLKQYANVYHSLDDNLFTSILAACKSFISTHTGLPLTVSINASIIQTAILTKYSNVTCTVTGNNITLVSTQVIGTDIAWIESEIQTVTGIVADTTTVSADNLTVNLTAKSVDSYEDLTIALFVLSNEMYDNRMITVDSNKVNYVIQQILDSHSVNYL